MTNHIRDFQILDCDQVGTLYQRCRLLMQPGVARVRDLAVQSRYLGAHLPAAVAAALAAGQRALTQAQFFLCAPRDAWIRDHNIIAAIGEHLESKINADGCRYRSLVGDSYGY